jgi:hypothetical protein
MPTNRVRRAAPARRQITPALMAMLQLGRIPEDTPGRSARFFPDFEDALEPAWREHGEAITDAWIAARPGSRPAGWWRYSAPEPRRDDEPEVVQLRRLRVLTRAEREALREVTDEARGGRPAV